jgi:3-deoxy-manno-octulosonate cytidylyltransferase (CMP-KDO synthetase)
MNPIILIPARMASTRLPDKPLADIAGLPMIVHVWKRAVEAGIGPVYVACDDERVAQVIKEAGGQSIMTRSDHPSGSDRIYEALCAIDPQKKYDVVVNVQGDVPTIEPEVIRSVMLPLENPAVDVATLACEIHEPSERSDPAVVKPVFRGTWHVTRATPVTRAVSFTRNAPKDNETAYHHIGIYAYRRAALERFVSLPPSPLELRDKLEQLRAIEAGMRIDVARVDTVPLGVDTPEHLQKARRIVLSAE